MDGVSKGKTLDVSFGRPICYRSLPPPRLGELFTNLYVIGCQSAKVRRLEAKVKHLGNSIFSWKVETYTVGPVEIESENF